MKAAPGKLIVLTSGILGIAVLVAAGFAFRDRLLRLGGWESNEEKVLTGGKAPPGWYVQVQSLVSAEHADLIVEHLRTLGYRRIWKRSIVTPRTKQPTDLYLIRLGPYPVKESALEGKEGFMKNMDRNPLKTPGKLKWAPFVLEYRRPADRWD